MHKVWTYRLQLPEKVAARLREWDQHPPFKGYNSDKAAILLSIVSTHLRKDDNGNIYAQLKMEYLRNIVYNAGRYIKAFIDGGIIVRIGGYVYKENRKPGETVHSYRYQFAPAVQSPYVTSELQNLALLKKIHKARTKKGRSESRYYPTQKHQLKTMTVNYDAAMALIKRQYPDKSDIRAMNLAVGQVTRIMNGDIYLKRDDNGHRVHTPLTNLPKFLRGEVQINGQYLSGLDISNSQVYFSIKLLLDPEGVKEFFPGKIPLMMLKCLRLSEQQDVAAFVLLAKEAKLYKFLEGEFIKAGLKIEVISDTKVSEATKKKIFTILFEENHLTSRAKKIFQRCFPNVDRAFSLFRMARFTDFVNVLTRIESYAIHELIISRLNREYPDMVAQQIYDNVVTSIVTDDIDTARRIMIEELTAFVGCSPVLKTENFRPTADFNSFSPLKDCKERKGRGRGGEKIPL